MFVSDDTNEFGGPVDICGVGAPIMNSNDDTTPGPDSDPTMPVSVTFDGSCSFAVELDTKLTVTDASNIVVGTNDNTSTSAMTFPGLRCSYLSGTLEPGTYTVQVTGGASFNPGTFRLHVRSGA